MLRRVVNLYEANASRSARERLGLKRSTRTDRRVEPESVLDAIT